MLLEILGPSIGPAVAVVLTSIAAARARLVQREASVQDLRIGLFDQADAARAAGLRVRWRGFVTSAARATISPAMQTRKREFWNNAEPERLPDQWRMREA